nr:MAG TPA: Tail fiber protein [Caudoviricetes sp.]
MTPAQKAAVAAILNTDLSTLDSDRLIELCVIYRAAPDALDTFPTALKAELVRRYSSEAIASEDVNFAVLQHMANQFQSAIPYFHLRLLEMAGTVNRDIWFTDHEALFRSSIDNAEAAAWLVKQPDILNKCLGNRLALGYLAQSTTAATAILSDEIASAVWKDAPDLWKVWPRHSAGMQVLAKSAELVQYIIDTTPALSAVIAAEPAMQALAASSTAMRIASASGKAMATFAANEVAMQVIAASEVAMKTVASSEIAMKAIVGNETAMKTVAGSEIAIKAVTSSEIAMKAIVGNETAMKTVAGSEIAMRAVAGSKVAMKAVAGSEVAMRGIASASLALLVILRTDAFRADLIANNTAFQAVRSVMYQTISKPDSGWQRSRAQREDSVASLNSTFANPLGFVFACLGYFSSPTASCTLHHPGGAEAAKAGSTINPSTMRSVDGVSFNGATFTEQGDGVAYAELWTPKG